MEEKENNKLEKGINLLAFETKNKIADVINGSHLPAVVVSQIIREISREVSVIEQREIQKERQEYLNAQKEGEKDGNISQKDMDK